jgi:hypothetical protein
VLCLCWDHSGGQAGRSEDCDDPVQEERALTQKVDGFLAADGTFFKAEAECERYEYVQQINGLCDSHNINADNFFAMLRAWSEQIKGYYNADGKCEQQEATATNGKLAFADLPSDDGDNEDDEDRDEDAPGFLEQQIRRRL